MTDAPPFDPSKPFQPEGDQPQAPPAFDPNQPFEVEHPAVTAKYKPTGAAGVIDRIYQAVAPDKPDAGTMFTRGMTAGAQDYAGAAGRYIGDRIVAPAGGAPSFNDELKGVRSDNAAYLKDNPVTGYGAEIAGGVASPLFATKAAEFIPAAAGAPAQYAVRQVTGSIPGLLGKGMEMVGGVPRYVGYGVQGAAAGAVAGAGNAQGQDGGLPTAGDLARSTGIGAAGGAALGVAVPAVAELAVKGARAVAQPIADRFAAAGPIDAASRKVLEALEADGLTPEQAIAKLKARGPEAMLADVSPSMTGLAEDAAQVRGPAQTAAARNLTSRQGTIMSTGGAGQRLSDNIQKNLSEGDFYGAIDTLSRQRSADARPLYEAAFAPSDAAPIKSEMIDRLMTRPVFQQGLRKGITDIMDEAAITGEDISPYQTYFEGENFDDPNLIVKKAPTLRILDAAKRGLDSILQGGGDEVRNSLTGKLTQRGMRIEQMRSNLVTELDNATGGADGVYAQARNAWAGPSRLMSAADAGRKLISTGDDEMVASALSKMSDGEKEAYRVGASKALQDMIDNTPDGANVANKLFGKQGLRDKLEAVFPTREAFNDFRKQVMTELSFANTKAQVLGNSATARRLIGQQQLGVDPTGPAIAAATGHPGKGLVDLALQGWKHLNLPSTKTAAALAPMFSRDQLQNVAFLQALRNRAAAGTVFGGAGPVIGTLPSATGAAFPALTSGGSNQ